jgi:hypothetical protein
VVWVSIKCDNKDPSIAILKNVVQFIDGYVKYTIVGFRDYRKDDSAFIFTLNINTNINDPIQQLCVSI